MATNGRERIIDIKAGAKELMGVVDGSVGQNSVVPHGFNGCTKRRCTSM